MELYAAIHILLHVHAEDWSPQDRELFPELVIALLASLADQVRGCDVDEELEQLRAAAQGLAPSADVTAAALLSMVINYAAHATAQFLALSTPRA